MATEQHAIDISDNPEMKELVAEVCRTRQPKVLRDEQTGAEVIVRPNAPRHSLARTQPKRSEDASPASAPALPRRRSPSTARPVTRDDALYRLVGIGTSATPTNDAEHKHEAIEEAHRRLHTP